MRHLQNFASIICVTKNDGWVIETKDPTWRGIEFSPRLRIITSPIVRIPMRNRREGEDERRKKERREGKHRLGGQFSSVHYRRSRVAHVQLEKHVLKPVSPDRFREPHAPGSRIRVPTLFLHPPRPSSPSSSSSSTSSLSFTAFTSRLFHAADVCDWKQRLPRGTDVGRTGFAFTYAIF